MIFSSLYRRFVPRTAKQISMISPTATPLTMYTFNPISSTWVPKIANAVDAFRVPLNMSMFAVLTWNIDFSRPFPKLRLGSLLSHLESTLFSSSPDEYPQALSTIILIQEFDIRCFEVLLAESFVRETYDITNVSSASLAATYGTVTLVPKALASYVSLVFRAPFPGSCMGRDALYVDLAIPSDAGDPTHLRIANTHLESLRGRGDVERPAQLASIIEVLSAPGIDGGLVGGDMNAIAPTDVGLPESLGFSDAWITAMSSHGALEAGETDIGTLVGGQPSIDADSHTWGYQPRSVYPPGRLDKILLSGILRVERIERVGVGLRVQGSKADGEWVSDHYGLLAKISIGSA
ncbi:Endonuclease/exonuclease/phosphatase [Infundibulicybe gibba]|nr:Endonuclease/exonuclease/phosphatase [Infundibulicybe gibba]